MFEWLGLETVAVLLGVAYLLFAMRENSLCWYCAFISTGIYIWIFGDVSLYMESALNAYYMLMAVYGWYQWQRGGNSSEGVKLSAWGNKKSSICHWPSVDFVGNIGLFAIAKHRCQNALY
jgi:nicotinamide mononucleotide transporter